LGEGPLLFLGTGTEKKKKKKKKKKKTLTAATRPPQEGQPSLAPLPRRRERAKTRHLPG